MLKIFKRRLLSKLALNIVVKSVGFAVKSRKTQTLDFVRQQRHLKAFQSPSSLPSIDLQLRPPVDIMAPTGICYPCTCIDDRNPKGGCPFDKGR